MSSFCSVGLTLDEDLTLWNDLGVRHVGLNVGKVEAAGWSTAADAVRSRGLRVSNVAGPAPAVADAPDDLRRAGNDLLRRGVDFAHAVGAPCVYVVTGGPGRLGWEDAAARFADAIAPIRDHAAASGVTVAIEPTNPLRADVSIVFSLRDTVRLARATGLGVVVELQACWLEPDFAATVRSAVDHIALVQVSDFVVGTLDTPNRAVPGDGDVPIERLVREVLDAGYKGAFDLELLGPRIEAEGYGPAIERSVARLSEYLVRAGA